MQQTRYLNIILSFAITLIVLVLCLSFYLAHKVFYANVWVVQTLKIMNTTDNVLVHVLEAESVTRAFLITNDAKFIENIDLHFTEIWNNYENLEQLLSPNSVQMQKSASLHELLDDKIDNLKEKIANRKKHNDAGLKELVYHGQQLTDQIIEIIHDIYISQEQLLQLHEAEILKGFNLSIFSIALSSVITLFALVAIGIYLNIILRSFQSFNTKLEGQGREMQLINEMNTMLGSCDGMQETISILTNYLKLLLPDCAGSIYLLKASANYLEAIAEWNDPVEKIKIFAPNQCWALRQGKSHEYFPDEKCVACEHTHSRNNGHASICVPLLAQNEVMGILYLELASYANESVGDLRRFVRMNEILIANLAGQIALAISNIKMHDALKTRSTRDPLTNLYNRSYLTDTLERDLQRAKRKQISMAVVMMDLDQFKQVNDTYGHEAGDTILKRISSLLMENIRASDVVCRYGGEEFLLVFYDISLEDTVARVEGLRHDIENIQVVFNTAKYSPTASFGIVMYPEQCSGDAEQLIKCADDALYQSKHNGRNTVTVYRNIL